MRESILLLFLGFHGNWVHPFTSEQCICLQRSCCLPSRPRSVALDADTFVSPVFPIYIEDTDAYGILYNGNYLKFYDRALCSVLPSDPWSLIRFDAQKFVASPALGDRVVVRGILQDGTWDLTMTSIDGNQVYNSIVNVTVAVPDQHGLMELPDPNKPPPKDSVDANLSSFIDTFPVFRDELDAQGRLPLRIALNYFERARSNYLGGPEQLHRLQSEDDLLAVVTSIADCGLASESRDYLVVQPGDLVNVRTSTKIKRKGMIIECHQTLETSNQSSSCPGIPLAQGKVTIMMINRTSRRPTAKLPAWLLEKLGQS